MCALDANVLTNSRLEISLTNVVWTYDTFKSYLQINHKLENYLMESGWYIFDQHFSVKYFLKDSFDREISPKWSGCFKAIQE